MTDATTTPGGAEEARSFEEALADLEDKVRQLDSGELPLEQALQVFEQGVKLQQECQDLLDRAEQQVIELTRAPATES
jgi:exodeoxyribonuclease VII small subunit